MAEAVQVVESARIGPERRRELAVGVVGCGRLGASLALGLASAGYRIAAVAGRGSRRAEGLAEAIPGARALAAPELVRGSDLILLAVPDDAVAAVAAALPWRRGQAAVHCAGALDLGPLAPLAARGAARGCLHPLQAFPDPGGSPERGRGIAVGIEAAEGAGTDLGALLEALAADLGAGATVRLEGVDRSCYHAAAVLASNDVVALAAAAARAWTLAGLPASEAPRALGPLLAGAASAVAGLPPGAALASALTGPLARGDLATVARHLDALAREPSLRALYAALGRELLALDLGHPPRSAAALAALLDGPEGGGTPQARARPPVEQA
ncbi:MAG: DUF2520 domain-containing protein [Chloroflexi bacterium]|nr:DUF2520 domain-containing protein [Chloroflexota bacterium]